MARQAHFVVVGGGTAGWIAAFIIQDSIRRLKLDARVSVIESTKIPTVGVGQALDCLFVDMVAFDAAVFTVTPLALLAACAAAAWLPALRAARLDPAQVLRSD